nr:PREDICTED: DNA polymerase theta-like [Latimeria chalumnae]|eukprot:XP_014347751.1 PREDICTED: DNA polymerase theta-like [Latimeria chalumnae]
MAKHRRASQWNPVTRTPFLNRTSRSSKLNILYINVSLAPPPLDQNLTAKDQLVRVASCLQDEAQSSGGRSVIAYNFKQQYKTLLLACALSPQGNVEDPKVASWLLDPDSEEHTLHNMVTNFLPEELPLLEGVSAGHGIQSLSTSADLEGHFRAAMESVLVFNTMNRLSELLQKENLQEIFKRVEMSTQYCLALLELNGIGFSMLECETQKHIMQAKLSAIEMQAYQLARHTFSLTSPDDIAEVQ